MQYGIITDAVFQRRRNNMSGDGPLPGNERDEKSPQEAFHEAFAKAGERIRTSGKGERK